MVMSLAMVVAAAVAEGQRSVQEKFDYLSDLNPNIGVEFALTEAVHLTLKVDRLIPLSDIEMPTGVRCYLGFVFAH